MDDELEPLDGPIDWRAAIEQNAEMGFDGLPADALPAAADILAGEIEAELAAVEHDGTA